MVEFLNWNSVFGGKKTRKEFFPLQLRCRNLRRLLGDDVSIAASSPARPVTTDIINGGQFNDATNVSWIFMNLSFMSNIGRASRSSVQQLITEVDWTAEEIVETLNSKSMTALFAFRVSNVVAFRNGRRATANINKVITIKTKVTIIGAVQQVDGVNKVILKSKRGVQRSGWEQTAVKRGLCDGRNDPNKH